MSNESKGKKVMCWNQIDEFLNSNAAKKASKDDIVVKSLMTQILQSEDNDEKRQAVARLANILSLNHSESAAKLLLNLCYMENDIQAIKGLIKLVSNNKELAPEFMQYLRALIQNNELVELPPKLICEIAVFVDEEITDEGDEKLIALQMYRIAGVEMDYKEAKVRLACLLAEIRDNPFTEKDLIDTLKEFHRKKHHLASYALGKVFLGKANRLEEKGKPKKKQKKAISKAIDYFKSAAKKNHLPSIEKLQKIYKNNKWLESREVEIARYKAAAKKINKTSKGGSKDNLVESEYLGSFERLCRSIEAKGI